MEKMGVLLSIDVYYFYLIAERIKRVEIRKTSPDSERWNRKTLLYVTRSRRNLRRIPKEKRAKYESCLGRVAGSFYCDAVDTMIPDFNPVTQQFVYNDNWQNTDWNSGMYCLTRDELQGYGRGKPLYGWHISDLIIYDAPRDYREIMVRCKTSCLSCKDPAYFNHLVFFDSDGKGVKAMAGCEEKGAKRITTPPQSWYYYEAALWAN